MATTPRKTFPELTALSAPVVDSDVLALYRSPGPAKRTTATTFADYLVKLASSFIQAGTGAVARTVQARMRDTVSAFDFIPVAEHAAISAGTSTYNATAAIQAAIDTGKTVEFPEGFYQVVGLTMSTNGQRLIALGSVNIQKRANGIILSSSANDIELNGITFRGDASTPTFTGDNVSLTGNGNRVINCGSLWASGRALKATGNNVVVLGSNPIWQTADASGTGFDVEIGVSGTATLYHYLEHIYTSQATGGILMTDTGSHTMIGGQFGKYSILSGTSPAGVNAGTTVGSRVIGNVQIGLSNGLFSAVAFSSITLTCLSGTSGISIDRSNTFAAGATVTNSGNVSNVIHLDGGVGGYQSTKFGGTTSLAVQAWDPASGNMLMPAGDILINGTDKGIRLSNNGHGLLPSGNNLALANTLGSTQVIPAGTLQLGGTNTNSVDITASGVSLLSGKVIELGHASDTTLARVSAGDISVEGNLIYRANGALAASGGAALVGYQRSATGALTNTLDTMLRENVYDYEFYTPDATPLPDATPQDAAYQNFINAAVGKNAVHTGFVTITGGSSDSTTLGGGAWTIFKSPITIPSNTHIVFQDRDSGVQCATSSLSNGAIFQLHAVSNVTFSGPGRIIGDRVTHTGVGGESLMGITVQGSSKVVIKDVHISNFWGDGILLSYDRLGNPCSNVVIDNVICDNNRRQGMSVTAGTDIDVTNSGFINTNGTAPQAGVDIEPDPGKNVSHIRFANCYFNGNAGDGFQVAPQNGTFVRGVMVTNCTSLSNGRDGFFWGGDGSTPGEGGQFTNCFARLNTEAGFRLSGKYTQLSNCHAFNYGTSGYRFRGEFTSLRLNSTASTGNFTAPVHTLSGITAGETITGGTSGATATVKYWNSVSKNLVATSIAGTFVTGETITGGSSGATMVIRSVLTEAASSFNTLTNCTARDNTAHGFYMEATSEHNKLVGCFAIGNSTGFRVVTDYNVFEACSALFNIGSGFATTSTGDNNVFSGGVASGNESAGVSMVGTGNTVRGMTLRHLGIQGSGISVTSTTGYNLIEGNDCYLSSRFSSDLVLTDTTTISRNNRNIQNHPHFSSGTNTPEAAVTAPIGSLFQRTNGSNGTSLYVKESGTGNTGWRPLAGYLSGSATYDAPSLLTLATTTTTVTVTGAAVGDFAECSFGVSLAGMIASAYVSAADTVTVVLFNATTGTVDLASTTLRARVRKA